MNICPCILMQYGLYEIRDTIQSKAFYIAMCLRVDHTREIIGIRNIPTESASG